LILERHDAAISRPHRSHVKEDGDAPPALKSPARRSISSFMVTRALVAAVLLAIPLLTSLVMVRRAGHPDVG